MGLGKVQKEILCLMNTGWELGLDRTAQGGFWIQQGGLGRGGEARYDLPNSIFSLIKQRLIQAMDNGFPTQRYVLTEKAKQILTTK